MGNRFSTLSALALLVAILGFAPLGDAQEEAPGEPFPLVGTAWQLVQIISMDDQIYTPEVPSSYTIAFGDDGSVIIRADCNRAQSNWVSPAANQLEFGPMAATKALCPPESLHDRYLSNLEAVRSYTLQEGNLFLATLADGAILEFEPMPATVTTPAEV